MTKNELIKKYVSQKIYFLSNSESGVSKAMQATLRHAVGKKPGELPEVWGIFLEDAPEGLYSENTSAAEPQKEEWAVYTALTLFAVHNQGNSVKAQQDGISLGTAAAKLLEKDNDEERARILRRFAPIVTAADMAELAYHLRSMVQLMKSKSIAIDYAQLACDIYDFQFDNSRKSVQLRWGRDFYRSNKETTE